MKLSLTVFSSLAVILLGMGAACAAPSLSFEQPVFDFGRVSPGKTVEHVFSFRNVGDAPATIDKVDSSCGCTIANVSTRVVKPGRSGEIKAAFNSTDFGGPVSKEIYVHSNDPRKPLQTLILKGFVIEDLVISPAQVDLGVVKQGVRKDADIKIENNGLKPLKLVSVKTASTQASVSWKKTRLKPGESCVVRLSVTPNGSQRFVSGYLTIRTDSASRPEKNVAFYAVLQK